MPTGTGPPSHPPNPALPFREDCWSEGATAVLIDAWGDRFLEVNRGHIRQKQWEEVADAVNSRRTAVKRPIRSAIQCKNRIDTIKKKYKAEKARVVDSGGTATSQWPFFPSLDYLISDGPSGTNNAPSSPPLALPLPHRKSHPIPPPAAVAIPPFARPKLSAPLGALLRKGNYSAAAAAAAAAAISPTPPPPPPPAPAAVKVEAGDDTESSASSSKKFGRKRTREMNGRSTGDHRGESGEIRELAQAILKFGTMYEKIESAKQKQMMELEKQRMEFTKRIEFQRMQVFVENLVRIEKAGFPNKQHNLSGSGDESKIESLKP